MKWVKITKKNIHNLKPGDVVKFNNGYEWDEREIGDFEIKRGFVLTGLHNETASFLYPNFGDGVYVKRSIN